MQPWHARCPPAAEPGGRAGRARQQAAASVAKGKNKRPAWGRPRPPSSQRASVQTSLPARTQSGGQCGTAAARALCCPSPAAAFSGLVCLVFPCVFSSTRRRPARPPLQDPRPWRQRTRSQRALRWCARMLRRWPQRSGVCVARAALRGLRALVRTPSPPPCSHLPAACGVRRVAGGRVRCPCSRRPASDPAGGRHTVRSVVRTLCRRWWRCRRRCPWRRSCWRTTRTSAILARTTCRRYARRPRRCPATSNGTSSGGCRATRPRCSSTP